MKRLVKKIKDSLYRLEEKYSNNLLFKGFKVNSKKDTKLSNMKQAHRSLFCKHDISRTKKMLKNYYGMINTIDNYVMILKNSTRPN